MATIDRWTSQGPGLPVVRQPTPGPGMAVAGEALARAGLGAMQDIGRERQRAEIEAQQRAEQAQQQRDTLGVERTVAEADLWADQTVKDMAAQAPEGADGFEAQVGEAWTARRAEMLANAQGLSPYARELLATRLDTRVGSRLSAQAADFATGSRVAKQVSDFDVIMNARANRVISNPAAHDDEAQDLAGLLTQLNLPAAKLSAVAQSARATLAKAAVAGQIDRDPARALQWLDGGRFDKALSPDDKVRLRNGAEGALRTREGEARQEAALARAEMRADIADMQTALRSGRMVDYDPPRIMAVMGPKDGRAALDALAQAGRYGADAAAIRYASPDEIAGMMAQRRDQQAANDVRGFADRQQEMASLARMVAERNRDLAEDPAGYVAASPLVGQRWQEYQNADPAQKAASFGTYVTATLAEQERLGVPAPLRHVLPKDQASLQVAALAQAKPEDAADAMAQQATLYGRHWPAAYRDLVKAGLSREHQVLATTDDPVGRVNLAAALAQDKDALRQAVGKNAKEIDDTVTGAMAPLYAALSLAPDGQEMAASYDKAVRLLAYRYAATGMDAGDAATQAASQVALGRWDFVATGANTYAMAPKGVGAMAEMWGMRQMLRLLPDRIADPGDPRGRVTGNTPDQRREKALASAERGAWLTNEDSTGWIRVGDDGQPVRLADGSILSFKFEDIDQSTLAAPYQMDEQGIKAAAARLGWSEERTRAYYAEQDWAQREAIARREGKQ